MVKSGCAARVRYRGKIRVRDRVRVRNRIKRWLN